MDLYKKSDRKFRPEIEGLRAVAAILVAVYHIWLGNVSGGVDVFFVVSGFLITTSLLSRLEKGNRIDASGFLLHLSKRLFPAAFTVLFIVTLGCFFLLPELRWSQTVKEVIASAVYLENWQLARNSVDYLAQNNEASPFQHFWAMSVQGQFYLIWPMLLFVSVLLAKFLFKKSVRFTFLITLLFIFSLSFAYSVYLTEVNQPWAYFDTFTRVWEFSMGGIVALLISNIVLQKTISVLFGWLGLLGLVFCGIVLQVSTVFPGYAALWPTLSAVFILLAGNQGGSFGVHRLLSAAPLVKFGSISYGFYLWHWPLLVFYFVISKKDTVSLFDGMIIMLIAGLLAFLTTAFVEKPVRNLKSLNTKRRTGAVSLAFMCSVLLLSGLWFGTIKYLQNNVVVLASGEVNEDYPGAAAMALGTEQTAERKYTPRPIQARNDLPRTYADGCHQSISKPEVIECEYGADNPDYTVALVGGSHSAQWLPALEIIAEEENIKILNYTKSACRFTSGKDEEQNCLVWNEELMDILLSKRPDLVFTTADVGKNVEPDVPKGYVEQWETLNEAGIPVFAVRDNPWFEFDVPSCMDENGINSVECAVEREKVLPAESAWSRLESPPGNVHYADLSDVLCDEYCRPVIGNVLVYRDTNHITATYMTTMAPVLREELVTVLEELK